MCNLPILHTDSLLLTLQANTSTYTQLKCVLKNATWMDVRSGTADCVVARRTTVQIELADVALQTVGAAGRRRLRDHEALADARLVGARNLDGRLLQVDLLAVRVLAVVLHNFVIIQ